MNTFIYTVQAIPGSDGDTKQKSQTLTGTTNVTFALSGLHPNYDASTSQYKINKVIVDFDEPGTNELVINRPLSTTNIPSLSSETFSHVLQTDVLDNRKRHVYMTIYRDDMEVDVIDISFTMKKPAINIYENINLLKTDYFTTEDDNEQILLSFINNNPEVIGMSLVDLDIPDAAIFDPALTGSQSVSTEQYNVGFTTEYVHVDAADSNTSDSIKIALNDIINTATGLPKRNSSVTLSYRTRAADPEEPENAAQYAPGNLDLFYIPLTANSCFVHLSGYLHWACGDLEKDIDLSTKTISIPLVDIVGTRTNLADSNYYYFTNVNSGCGTSASQFARGGYFYVDIFDVTGCDSVTTTTSTITAFVNY